MGEKRSMGWARVRFARLRRSARGRVSWLADDLASDELPPLDRLEDEQPGKPPARRGRPALAVVPDPVGDGPAPEDGVADGPGDGEDGPIGGVVPTRSGRGSVMP